MQWRSSFFKNDIQTNYVMEYLNDYDENAKNNNFILKVYF